jgi:hypothetical protein
MARRSATHQPSLFDAEPPRVTPCPKRMIELRGFLECLMREIAQTLTNVRSGKDGHEQDNG